MECKRTAMQRDLGQEHEDLQPDRQEFVELSYDLHIHSCLSPCGDDDMTPGNIVGMSAIKGLDVIAVTDHNSCRNCPAVMKLAKQYGVLAIPGMELTTVEEVHAVCLFPELSAAMEFDRFVYEKLMKFPNREEIFGKQQIMNEEDICIGTEPNLLINSRAVRRCYDPGPHRQKRQQPHFQSGLCASGE